MTCKSCHRTGPSRELLAWEAACGMGKPVLRATQPTAQSTLEPIQTRISLPFPPRTASHIQVWRKSISLAEPQSHQNPNCKGVWEIKVLHFPTCALKELARWSIVSATVRIPDSERCLPTYGLEKKLWSRRTRGPKRWPLTVAGPREGNWPTMGA